MTKMTEEEKKECLKRLHGLILEVAALKQKRKQSNGGFTKTIKILEEDIKKYSEAVLFSDMTLLES